MANIVLLPQIGISEESAVVAKFFVKQGDSVKKGDNLFELETGKAAFEVQSDFDGEVLAILCEPGDELLIKEPVLAIGAPGEAFEAPKKAESEAPAQTAAATTQAAEATPTPVTAAATQAASDILAISKRAKALAEKAGVNPAVATPTGPNGRIIERDIEAVLNTPNWRDLQPVVTYSTDADFEDKPLSKVRKVIAANMHKSLSEMAQLTLNASFDATAMLAYRKKCKNDSKLSGVTLNDVILYTLSRVLLQHPDMNAHFLGDSMRYFSNVHLACAVDTPRGLLVPVLKCANRMDILTMSNTMKELAKAAQEGSIDPSLLTGGTFTMSNLGSLGIESFTPVINPPQTGILGVNTLTKRVRATGNGIEVYDVMTLSITFDHRSLDGAPCARFLQDLCRALEAFDGEEIHVERK